MRKLLGLARHSNGHIQQSILGGLHSRPFFSFLWEEQDGTHPRAPIAEVEFRDRQAFGHKWKDPFSWMEDRSWRFGEYLTEERRHFTGQLLTGLQAQQEEIYKRALELSGGQDQNWHEGFCEQIGPYLYYTRTSQDEPLDHYLRRAANSTGPEQSVMDINSLARQHTGAVEIGRMKLSDSHDLLAFTLSVDGNEASAIVKEIATGKVLGVIDRADSIEWLADNRTILYTVLDGPLRPYQVKRHVLGRQQVLDETLLSEDYSNRFLGLTKTKDGRYVIISSNSKTSSEVHLLDAYNAEGRPQLVQERQDNLEYFVEHHAGRLMILTNANGAGNNCLVTASVTAPEQRHWAVIVPARCGVAIEDLDVFSSFAVLWERHNGLPGFSILPLSPSSSLPRATVKPRVEEELDSLQPGILQPMEGSAKQLRSFVFPPEGGVTDVKLGANADFHSSVISLQTSSLVERGQTIVLDALNLKEGHEGWCWNESSSRSLPQRLLSKDLRCWQEFATSPDGTQIPITLAHRESHSPSNGRQPCVLEVYGAYGTSLETGFTATNAVLLEQGWTLAFAHVRGGGELGRNWHHAGRQSGKMHALQDANACLDHLLSRSYASRGSIALRAASAGGVLAGNLLVSRPSDFGAAVLRMPFLDLFTAMMDPSQTLTEHEWDEWGSPHAPEGIRLLKTICPYQAALQGIDLGEKEDFPALLVTIATDDDRVPAWMPAKWVAAVRRQLGNRCKISVNVVEGGHHMSGASEAELGALEVAHMICHIQNT